MFWVIFQRFFVLGWVSFGGPAAHIGYFRNEFVHRLAWLSDQQYGQFVALSQFLPGPGSSQVGFSVGYHKGGILGGIAAFLGFTLPSVFIMLLLAGVSHWFIGHPLYLSLIHALKILAVVVVMDAVWGMYKNFCTSKLTLSLCVLTACALLIAPSLTTQLMVLLFSAGVGAVKLSSLSQYGDTFSFKKTLYLPPLLIFLLLLALPILMPTALSSLFSAFFQAGSLVFGGGHVVLPLLQEFVGTQLSQNAFLTGYAAAQAVPGPMFTFATYLGFELMPNAPITGALIATLAVFLPGFLLLLAVLKHWQTLANYPKVKGAMDGVNAAVVGLLLAALYQPVFVSAVESASDLAAVIVGVYLLKVQRCPILGLVIIALGYGALRNWIG